MNNKIKNYKINDIEKVVSQFKSKNEPTHRYASFDYCYNYFKNSSSNQLESDLEKSCLQLGFYLASWGMLRGSSFLLQKSVKHYEELIKYFIKIKKDNHKIWSIDINNYSDENINLILEVYDEIKKNVIGNNKHIHIVTVTKIMMGVFGCIPAYDKYFTETFRKISVNYNQSKFRSVNKKSLICLKDFYYDNKSVIDNLQLKFTTKDFKTSKSTNIIYTKAKIIDMYGFTKAFK